MLLTREQILSKGGPATEEVEIPEWGQDAKVRVRGMTGRERDEFEASQMRMKGGKMVPDIANTRAKLIIRCAVDEVGHQIFTYGDIQALGELSAAPLQRIFDVAAKLSGMTPDDIKEMVADFGTAPGDGGSSNSQNGSTAPSGTSWSPPTRES